MTAAELSQIVSFFMGGLVGIAFVIAASSKWR